MINAAQSGHPNLDQVATPVTAESRSIAADRVSLLALIARWERRRRLTATAIGVPRGALIGLILAGVIAGLGRIRPLLLPGQLVPIVLAIILGSMLLAVLVIWLWPRPITAAVRMFDRRFAASERLSTAFELADPNRQSSGSFAALQVRDARRYAEAIDARARLPIRWQRRELVVGLVLALIVALLIVLPNPQTALITTQNAIQTAINQQIQGLTQIAHDAQANATLTDAQKAAINKTAQDAIQQLSQPGVGQTEAAAILSAAAQKFQDTPAQLNSPLQTAEQQAGTALTTGGQTSNPALAPGIEQLGANLQQGNLPAAANAAQSLSQTLGNMQTTPPTVSAKPTTPALVATLSATSAATPSNVTQSATPAATTSAVPNAADPAAASAFSQAANALQPADPQTAQAFQAAAKALQNGDLAQAQKSLAQAGQSLQALQQKQDQSPLSQAAQKAAQQASKGAEQVAKGGGDQTPANNTPGQPPSGQQPSTGAQNGAPSANPSGDGQPNNGQNATGQSSNPSATDQSGAQSGQPAPGGNSGKSGGVQTGPGQVGPVDSSAPQLINPNGQSPTGSGPGGGAGGPPSAGQGSGGPGSNVTNGNGSTTNPPTNPIANNNGQGTGALATPESVYAPSFAGGNGGQQIVVPNAPNTDSNAPIITQNNAPPTQQASASVPLDTVIGAAVTQSDLAMDEAHVPISLRGVIHDYFSGLQNAASQAASTAQPNPSATSQSGSP